MSACTTLEAAMHEPEDRDDERYPPGFRSYLLADWPLRRDWIPGRLPTKSGLRREYFQMHEKRRDGGVPPLLKSFMDDLDKWAQPRAAAAAGHACTAHDVGLVLAQLRASALRETRQKMAVLHFFQFREIHPDLPTWCDERALAERTAYRYCNDAVAMVWKYLVARQEGFGVTGLAESGRSDGGIPPVT